MSNRFQTPSEQFVDTTGAPYSGGKLFFYTTGTSTKTNTYTTSALSVANANPVVLDSAGRAGNIWLDPAVSYKVVFSPSTDSDPPANPIFTADPVVDPAANVAAAFQVYPGNPNTHVAGSQGAQGGAGASVVWDTTNNLLYVCTTTGVAAAAVWTQVAANISGAVVISGVITPTTLAADTNDYAPTSLSTAYTLRLAASSAVNITGLTAGVAGRVVVALNVGTFAITLCSENASSTAANRFLFDYDVALAPNQSIALQYDGVSSRWRPAGRANVEALATPGGRLTLTTATPVMTSDVTSATTVYYTPYLGFFAPLYNGTNTAMVNLGSELSVALDSNSGHTGYHQSGKIYDFFVTKDTITPRLISGPAWTSDSARSTALEYKNGFLCNAASMTGRFGSASGNTITVAQDQALYVGSVRMSADGTTKWLANPAAAAGGGACLLLVFNAYNRVPVTSMSKDSTDTWTYATATWRSANNNTANRISVLFGLAEDAVTATYGGVAELGANPAQFESGIGLDVTNAFSGVPGVGYLAYVNGTTLPAVWTTAIAVYLGVPGIGYHFFQALERVESSTITFHGDNAAPTVYQTTLFFQGRM